jgi:hypothetical protein
MDMLYSVRTEKGEDKVADVEWHSEVSARTYRFLGYLVVKFKPAIYDNFIGICIGCRDIVRDSPRETRLLVYSHASYIV